MTKAFVWDPPDVEERPLEGSQLTAPEEHPWQPPEGWAALLQRRQRRELVGELAFVAVVVAVTGVLIALAWPRTVPFFVSGGLALLGSGIRLRLRAIDQAEEIRTMSRLGLGGWPVLIVAGAVAATGSDRLWFQVLAGVGAVLCVVALLRSRRRDRWARRWLADPLPRA